MDFTPMRFVYRYWLATFRGVLILSFKTRTLVKGPRNIWAIDNRSVSSPKSFQRRPEIEQFEIRALLNSDVPFVYLQNPTNPFDVDNNGVVEPTDALIAINALNGAQISRSGNSTFATPSVEPINQIPNQPIFLDANGEFNNNRCRTDHRRDQFSRYPKQ
jgi:hypothetical protein